MRKTIFFLFTFLSYILVLAQVDTAWVRRYNGPGNGADGARAIAVDNFGNVYVTGQSEGSGTGVDYCTIKYYPNGDTAWVRRYNGPGNGTDYVSAIAIDGSGNVCVTGGSYGGSFTDNDYATIKYNSNGNLVWIRRYDGPAFGHDFAGDVRVDNSGNVYVTGGSYSGPAAGNDYATIKYYSNGNIAWTKRFGIPGNTGEFASAIAVDNSDNVYVTGNTVSAASFYDYLTIKYFPNGDTAWVNVYNGSGNYADEVRGIALDNSNNVYVTGVSVVAGSYDYATIKYNPNGDTAWVRTYNGLGKGYDGPIGVVTDAIGNVYVTGWSDGSGTSQDYATIMYYPNGDTAWVGIYNGPANWRDLPHAIAVDDSGNTYVTGESIGGGTDFDYATVKHLHNGDIAWVARYNSSANWFERGTAIAVNDSGNIYVTGVSAGTETDYVTIKYTQFTCLAKSGDANNDNDVLLSDIVTIIDHVFKSQPAPNPSCRADANADGNILLSDIVHLINFLFRSGPVPQKSRECCL